MCNWGVMEHFVSELSNETCIQIKMLNVAQDPSFSQQQD
jgi:hypothetical protein